MAGVSNVQFKYSNGNLGGTNPSNDGVAGLIIQAPTPIAKLAFGVSKAIYSLDDAVNLEITELYDERNSCSVYGEISDYYAKTGGSGELWIMLVDDQTSMADICNLQNSYAAKLLIDSGGNIRFWGVAMNRDANYSTQTPDGLDYDVFSALANAQALRDAFALKRYMPTRVVLPGRAFSGDVSSLRNLKQGSDNGVMITLHGRQGSKEARVGFMLGLIASLPVQRNIGRVASGDLGITEAYLTDGATKAEELSGQTNDGVKADIVHDKGYIFPVVRPSLNGFFYNDDSMATSNIDDYNSLANGRVIDKVQRIAYNVFAQRINDDYALSPEGKIGVAELKSLQGSIEDAINPTMVSGGELSSFACYVDPNQDPIAAGKIVVKLKAQPRGYHKHIEVELGFVKSQIS